MTRFARSEGSKASNKRKFEDSTPWDVLKNKGNKKKKKSDKSAKFLAKEKGTSADVDNVNIQIEEKVDVVSNKSKNKVKKQKESVDFIYENGMRYKVFKNGKKKPWFDLPYEENEIMTKFDKFFVKREDVDNLNKLKASMEDENLEAKTMGNKMLHSERKAHNKLRVQLLREQMKNAAQLKKEQGIETENTHSNSTQHKYPPINYEENDFMTCVEGYWIKKESVKYLDGIEKMKIVRIIKSRTDENTSEELTTEEKLTLQRLMKKERRREARMLKLELIQNNIEAKPQKQKLRKPGKYLGVDFNEMDMVKFEGFFVKKDAAERLQILRDKLEANGCTEEEITTTLKNERRKEERILKREKKQFCYKCRQSGHVFSLCPQNTQFSNTGAEICFRCGSTEHMARECSVSGKGSGFSHATCFYCGEGGHIARECPDNPRGLYPQGGCCRECGSVEHLRKDCPDLKKSSEDTTMTLALRTPDDSIDTESFQGETYNTATRNHEIKRVQFN